MITVLLVLGCLWVAFNLLAPFSVILQADRISWGRLPAELLVLQQYKKVRFYMMPLKGGYGYSVLAPPLNLVVFDRTFFAKASPPLIRFVIAHELAHFTLGHHRKRWLCVVSGLVLLPVVKRWLLRMEEEADVVAEKRTGYTRRLFPELRGGV